MSTTTGGLPLMDQTQPQRYLTFNEVAWALNVLQTGVISRSETTPPVSPSVGDAYIPAAPATDEWAGHENDIAFYFGGVWNFLEPELAQGNGIYVQDEDLRVRWDALGSEPMYVQVSTGDVTGPASSVDSVVALFNGTDGKLLKSTGTANIPEALQLTGDISPAQITANTDDYNPTGLSTASVLRLSTDASRNLTGIQGGADGRVLVLHNVGSFDLVLKDDTTSTAGNRFQLNSDITIGPNQSTVIQYDSTSSRWRVIGGQGSSGGAVTSVNGASGAVSLNGGYIGTKGADIASASTTDLSTATGDWVDVTGTTTITALSTATAGIERLVRFTGILTLTYNATSLILPTSANITTAANDFARFRSLGSGNWVCVSYQRASGSALASSGGSSDLVLISEVVTTGSQATVAFSSISSAYRDLEIRVRARGTASATNAFVLARFNGDTGANYDWEDMHAFGSTVSAVQGVADTSLFLSIIPAATAPSNAAGIIDTAIADYRGTTFYKALTSRSAVQIGTGGSTQGAYLTGGLWRSTSAITSITILLGAGNFVDGSVVSLYGRN